ncbi:hypothetical protein [Candidatus Poriferisodalis sp.]|uniref:hypothetical protein n=1 Tax=Candidatus Poriferisodalis sp. TaxID=3101277 RepID=UPI003B02DBB2
MGRPPARLALHKNKSLGGRVAGGAMACQSAAGRIAHAPRFACKTAPVTVQRRQVY